MLEGKFRCIQAFKGIMTFGKIYTFEGGVTLFDNGCYSPKFCSVEDFNSKCLQKIEALSTQEQKRSVERREVGKFFILTEVERSPFLPMRKSLLKSGYKIVNERGQEFFVLTETARVYEKDGPGFIPMSHYSEDLRRLHQRTAKNIDIAEVWDGDTLIMKRDKKTPQELKIERIANEIRKLVDELEEAKESL